MEQFYLAADRRLLRFGAVLAGLSLVAFGAVASFVFRYSVDCFDGNPVTWLFADRAMEAAEAKELSASLAAHPTFNDVAVIRVRGRHATLLVRDDFATIRRRGLSDFDYEEPLGRLWQSVYDEHHLRGSHPTNMSILYGAKPGAVVGRAQPASCASL